MTYETYEAATELRSKIDYYESIDGLLQNAAHKGNNLAAINKQQYSDDLKILNQHYLTTELLVKFRDVIRAEISELKLQFGRL